MNVMEAAARMYVEIQSNGISHFFFWLIVAVFIVATLCVLRLRNPRFRAIADMAPGIMTTLGIVGTFTGIALGLLDFDVQLIDESIPKLLEGLKIAFLTSVAGLAAALLFRVIRLGMQPIHSYEEVGIENIVDELKRLNGAFKTYTEQISETVSKALMDELKEVVHEFNEKLSEQFGQNFKNFNEALGEIITWQDNNRAQLADMTELLEKATKRMKEASEQLENVAENTSRIPEHLKELERIYQTLRTELGMLGATIEAVMEIGREAAGALPEIAAKIKNLTDILHGTIANMKKTIETIMKDLEETHKQMLDGLQNAINGTITKATEGLDDGMKKLDEGIQRELEKALEEMAGYLSGITKRLVDDYEPLLKITREITELAKKARDNE